MGDALSERHRDRIVIKALSLKPCALPALSFVEGGLLSKVMAYTTDAALIRRPNTLERYQQFRCMRIPRGGVFTEPNC